MAQQSHDCILNATQLRITIDISRSKDLIHGSIDPVGIRNHAHSSRNAARIESDNDRIYETNLIESNSIGIQMTDSISRPNISDLFG